MRLLRLFILILSLLLISPKAYSQVKVDAFSRYNNEGLLEVLLKFEIAKGWHMFAAYDQEFGSPLHVDWSQNADIKIYEESFSAPQEYKIDEFIYDGYEKKAYYKTTLDWRSKDRPNAQISWQVCAGDECLPQSIRLKLPQADHKLYQKQLIIATPYFAPQKGNPRHNLWIVILSALLGGLILNLMPCVLPVLGLKALTLVKTAPTKRYREAFFYTFGVLFSMLVLATVLWLLRHYNPHLGWGFQMQSPIFTGIMLVVFIILVLVLFNWVHISGKWLNYLNKLHFNTPSMEAFASGMLAVLIASPCTAPFMGMAIGYALFAPLYIMFIIFLSLGLGYAIPYAALALSPKITSKILPKAGSWLKVFKIVMGIPLILTVIWLSWVFLTQIGVLINNRHLNWEKYSPQAVEETLQKHQPVFIDFTADWCITCLVNHKTSLQSSAMSELVDKLNIKLYKADLTKMDKQAAQGLKLYNRLSIPLYVYYDSKSDDYIILPQILTPQILRDYIK